MSVAGVIRLQNITCFQAISEHCVGRGILHPNTTWCLRPCMIAFSGLNLFVRFNHSKYVHTKIKLINKLGIFLYFPHRYFSRIGNCPFANSQQNIGTKILSTNYYENLCLWVYEHIYCISVKHSFII